MKEKFTITVISQLGHHIINTIAVYFLFLKLEIELMGILVLFRSFIELGFIFREMGFKNIHFRYSIKKDFDEYFSTFFLIRFFLIIESICFTLILITILQLWNSYYSLLIILLLLSKITFSLTHIFLDNLIARKKIFKSELPFFFINSGKSTSIIILAFNISNISNPLLFIGIIEFGFDFILLIIILILSKNEIIIKKPQKQMALNYLKETKPFIINSVLAVFVININNIILDFSFGHAALAQISLINQIIILILLIPNSLIPLSHVIYSQYFEEGQNSLIEKTSHTFEKYFSILFLSLILIVFFSGDLLLSIFLPNYFNSLPILYIMILIPYIYGTSTPYGNLMVPGKKQHVITSLNIIFLSLTLLLMILFIPESFLMFNLLGLGTIGYALASTIPYFIFVISNRYFSKKFFNITSQKIILSHIIFALSSLLISFLLRHFMLNFLIGNQFLLLIVSIFVILGIFFGELIVFKQLRKNDLIFLLDLLKLKRYRDSLIEEFSIR